MLSIQEANEIVSRITYKPGWELRLSEGESDWNLYVWFRAIDAMTGETSWFRGRRWAISPHSDEESLVGTCLLAIKTVEEHETLEFFKYDGVSIFNPHMTIAARKSAFEQSFQSQTFGPETPDVVQ